MTCTFLSGELSAMATPAFADLQRPLVPGSQPLYYVLEEGYVFLQQWRLANCQVYYFCARLQRPATFELRHTGEGETIIVNLCGKLVIQEYQSGSHCLNALRGQFLMQRNVQGFGTLRDNRQVSRLMVVTYIREDAAHNDRDHKSINLPFILTAKMIELIDKILYTSYQDIRHFHKEQFAELLILAKQSAVQPGNHITIKADDLAVIHEIKKWIDLHLDKDQTLKQLARKAGMHERKLNLAFQNLFGKTIYEYKREQKLLASHEKIQSSHIQLKLIGRAAGYRSYSNFSTAFRARFGITPVSLRKK